MEGPCILKMPSPSTWPSILETVAEQLHPTCQAALLSWLYYQQEASVNKVVAMSRGLFKAKSHCNHLGDLQYINLLDRHENLAMVVPDAIELRSQKKIIT